MLQRAALPCTVLNCASRPVSLGGRRLIGKGNEGEVCAADAGELVLRVVRAGLRRAMQVEGEAEEGPALQAAHLPGLVIGYEKRLRGLRDDWRHERQLPRRKRLRVAEKRQSVIDAHHRRLDSLMHEAAATVQKYALRRA